MSRSPQPLNHSLLLARNFGLGVLTFVGVRTAYLHAVDLVTADPFASLRKETQTGIEDSVGIRLQNVHVKAYHRGQLVTSVFGDRVDINKDRQLFTLTGIHDGVFREDGQQYQYEAVQGLWRANAHQLTINGAARVQNADMDLKTTALVFDKDQHSLRALQTVSGRLYKGQIRAEAFHLDTKTHNFDTGAVDYRGDLPLLQKESGSDDSQANKPWHVSGESVKAAPSMRYYVRGRAEDDDMILKSDLIAQNLKTDVMVATGNVKYFSGKADITADKATIYHKERRVVLVGHVTIFVKPKSDQDKPPKEEPLPEFQRLNPDTVVAGGLAQSNAAVGPVPGVKDLKAGLPSGLKPKDVKSDASKTTPPRTPEEKQLDDDLRSGKTIRQYPMVIMCDQVDYWYRKGERHGHVIGSPQGRQDLPSGRWRYVWSTTADYDAEKDELTLLSTQGKLDVRMKNSKGDDLVALDMTVSTKEDSDEEVYRGRKVTGTVLSDEDADTPNDKKAKPLTDKSKPPVAKTNGVGGGAGSGRI